MLLKCPSSQTAAVVQFVLFSPRTQNIPRGSISFPFTKHTPTPNSLSSESLSISIWPWGGQPDWYLRLNLLKTHLYPTYKHIRIKRRFGGGGVSVHLCPRNPWLVPLSPYQAPCRPHTISSSFYSARRCTTTSQNSASLPTASYQKEILVPPMAQTAKLLPIIMTIHWWVTVSM